MSATQSKPGPFATGADATKQFVSDLSKTDDEKSDAKVAADKVKAEKTPAEKGAATRKKNQRAEARADAKADAQAANDSPLHHAGDDDEDVTFVETETQRRLIIRRTEQGTLLSCRDAETGEDVEVPLESRFLTN